jgi:hypothetical protein
MLLSRLADCEAVIVELLDPLLELVRADRRAVILRLKVRQGLGH